MEVPELGREMGEIDCIPVVNHEPESRIDLKQVVDDVTGPTREDGVEEMALLLVLNVVRPPGVHEVYKAVHGGVERTNLDEMGASLE
jgi:hypothetical protein